MYRWFCCKWHCCPLASHYFLVASPYPGVVNEYWVGSNFLNAFSPVGQPWLQLGQSWVRYMYCAQDKSRYDLAIFILFLPLADCHPTCLNCDAGSPSDCTSCIEGMQLSGPDGHGMCQFGCREGHYLNSNGECLPCGSENCFTCYGPDESQCLSCNLGYLRTGMPLPSTNISPKLLLSYVDVSFFYLFPVLLLSYLLSYNLFSLCLSLLLQIFWNLSLNLFHASVSAILTMQL